MWFGPRDRSRSELGTVLALSVRAVPRVSLVAPIWLRTARGLRRPCTYERTCVCICACECGTHVYSTRTGPGHERTCVFVCACECGTHVYSTRTGPGHGCVLPTGRGVRPEFILGLCATFSSVYVGYDVRLGQCEQCILYVCVCTAVGMYSPSVVPLAVSTCMRALYSIWHGGLGSVGSIHECYSHVCTVGVPLEQCLAWLVRAMYLSCSCLYCACTIAQCVLGLYSLYGVLAWPTRVMYLLTRACTCTVLVPSHSVYGACTPCTVIRHGQPGQCTCVLCLYLLYSGLA